MTTEMRFQIVFTYGCNLRCRYCDRFLDVLPWPDTEITPEELMTGVAHLEDAGVRCSMSRIGGGEALVHPFFEGLTKDVVKYWSMNGTVKTTVATNGINPRPKIKGVKYKCSPPDDKQHMPVMISPADLGIPFEHGVYDTCRVAAVCGRGFDCHGFASCPYAGPIGRIIGHDPYHVYPVLHGDPEICRHCIHSLGKQTKERIWREAVEGKIQFPTDTFAEGLNRLAAGGESSFKRFLER